MKVSGQCLVMKFCAFLVGFFGGHFLTRIHMKNAEIEVDGKFIVAQCVDYPD